MLNNTFQEWLFQVSKKLSMLAFKYNTLPPDAKKYTDRFSSTNTDKASHLP